MESPEEPDQQDLRAYLRVLNRRKLTVGVIAGVIVVLAVLYSLIKTPIYTASTVVLVPEQSASSALQPASSQQTPAPDSLQRNLSDAQQFALGDQTKAAALAILHYKAKVAVTVSTTADLLTFTANSTSKAEAAATANGYAQAFINANRANEVAQYTKQVQAIQASIATLQQTATNPRSSSQDQGAAQSSITSLTESLQQLQAASQLVASASPTISNAATPPTAPSSPKLARDVILALVVGLLLGVGVAFGRDRLDDKVNSMTDVEANSAGHPIIGAIPLVDSWRNNTAAHVALEEDTDSAASEAYRTLRTAIQFLGIDDLQRVIGITSSTPNEGKSTATANLAVSFARAGQQVVAMSCDFRKPKLHSFFGLSNDTGATSVLLGETTLKRAIRDVPGEPNLRVLPSGPVPPNPAEILSLDRVRQLINVLAANSDVLLIDCPPVLPVTDTLLISRLCDTILVMTAAGTTKRADLQRTYGILEQVKAPVRGTIVNRVPSQGAYATGYGYGYGYGYSTDETPGQDRYTTAAASSKKESRRTLLSKLSVAESASRRKSEALERGAVDDFAAFDEQAVRSPNRNGSGE